MLRHHAALASGKLTRVTSGVNLPPLEVIMSRPSRQKEGIQTGVYPTNMIFVLYCPLLTEEGRHGRQM